MKTEWTKEDFQIKEEIYKCLVNMKASMDVLALVGSWKDTLDDKELLVLWKAQNKTGTYWKKIIASV